MAAAVGIKLPLSVPVVLPLMYAVHECAAVVLRRIQVVRVKNVNGIAFVPVQTIVIMITPISAIGG